MPTYPYACTACDNRFEVVQAFTDHALSTCEQCGGRLRKVFSSVGVVFKGSGFYRNDSRAPVGAASGTAASTSAANAGPSSGAGGSGGSNDNGTGGSGGTGGSASSNGAAPAKAEPAAKASSNGTPARAGTAKGSDSAA